MRAFIAILSALILSSCSSLSSSQKVELKEWQAQNLEIQEKSPGTAAALNILPGIGDFYNGNVGLGVLNLLTWPTSILWAPVGGASGAEEVNYYSTKTNVEKHEKNKVATKTNLDEALQMKQINNDEHFIAMKKVNNMDLKEFKNPKNVDDIIMLRTPSSKN